MISDNDSLRGGWRHWNLHLALGLLAVTALVTAMSAVRSSADVELLESSAFFPGAGKDVANWIEKWEHLANVENVNSQKSQTSKETTADAVNNLGGRNVVTRSSAKFQTHPQARDVKQLHASLASAHQPQKKVVDVADKWKKWATKKAKSLHEKTHRIAVGPGGWAVYVDAASARPFYFNQETGMSQWTSPWSKKLAHAPSQPPPKPAVVQTEKVGGDFDVKAQQQDMNEYFDSLQQNIDKKIISRQNAVIKEFGEDKWKPDENRRLVRPAPVRRFVQVAPPTQMASPPTASSKSTAVASKKAVKTKTIHSSSNKGTMKVAGKQAQVLAEAWDNMEGGEGSVMEAREHY